MSSDLIDELLGCQRRLSHALLERHPEVRGSDWLVGFRISGDLDVNGELWTVAQHGAGAAFTRQVPAPQLVVDMHTSVSNPEVVDAWRIQQFAESKGQSLSYAEAAQLLQKRRSVA